MATKSFLTPQDFEEAANVLQPPHRKPTGDETQQSDFSSPQFSKWLSDCLLDRLKAHPDWESSGPIALGSWSRGELCPKSDIDVLFCGPEENVRRLVDHFSKQGLRLRYRVPEDRSDWTIGVQPFDVLALYGAIPLTESAATLLAEQIDELKTRSKSFRRDLLKAMKNERVGRAQRFDSISNYLEPNLKMGSGGLRDLEQALVTRALFPESFSSEHDHAFDVLIYYKSFFLLVRQKLHLSMGSGDVLSAPEQRPIAEWLGFKDNKDFMREIQKGISRVSFYADWAVAQASSSKVSRERVEKRSLKDVNSLFKALEEDPGILMQNRVRLAADPLFAGLTKTGRQEADSIIGKHLGRFISAEVSEGPLVALFRARLIDHCVPEFKRIVGHVQHDQYHRFSVDAHVLQTLRELKRLHAHPRLAGRLATVVKSLTKREWEILSYACLYHDIAKGREGDHSIEGIGIAEGDLARFGKDTALVREVTWIVREHLSLSTAAFRENSQSPRVWRWLDEHGVKGRRLRILAAFTIIDIRATNPEAWTPWKERLLHDLVTQIEKPEANAVVGFAHALQETGLEGWEVYTESLDPFLVASLPSKRLAKDLREVFEASANGVDSPVRIVRVAGGKQTWIRFHSHKDQAGLFHGFVRWLAASNLGVRHASIYTDEKIGVYDWFEVKTTKAPAQVDRLIASAMKVSSSSSKQKQITFDAIDVLSTNPDEWVISFRGRDQAGALLAATSALFDEGISIRWAKVHTWGRQIDDVFGVKPTADKAEFLLNRLKERLQITS